MTVMVTVYGDDDGEEVIPTFDSYIVRYYETLYHRGIDLYCAPCEHFQ